MKRYYVYILRCNDGSYYTGITNNVERRFYEHQNGMINNCYTDKRRPLKLVFTEEFSEVNDAIAREKQIKGWTRRKKEALIEGNFKRLVDLSKRPSMNSG